MSVLTSNSTQSGDGPEIPLVKIVKPPLDLSISEVDARTCTMVEANSRVSDQKGIHVHSQATESEAIP